jgi:hypothetical protein
MLDLQLEKCSEKLGFVGSAHLNWMSSSEMRRRAAFSRIVPNENYHSPRDPEFVDIVTRRAIWNQSDAEALINDRETDDLIGLGKTVELVVDTFNATAAAYFSVWGRASRPYREFTAMLELIKLQTFRNCRRGKWPHRLKWFTHRVVPLANARIDMESWRNRARDFELARLSQIPAGAPAEPEPVRAAPPTPKAAASAVAVTEGEPPAPDAKISAAPEASPDAADTIEAPPATEPPQENPPPRKTRGRQLDLDTSARFSAAVKRVAPDGNWRRMWQEVLEDMDGIPLDEEGEKPEPYPICTSWKNNYHWTRWSQCDNRRLAVKYIGRQLNKQPKN